MVQIKMPFTMADCIAAVYSSKITLRMLMFLWGFFCAN